MSAPWHIPYHRYWLDQTEEAAVQEVLRSGWLTTGPKVQAFETAFSAYKGGVHAIGVSACTAGLALLVASLDLAPGDEIITTPMTFAATANVIVHHGGVPILADIDPATLTLSPQAVAQRLTERTKAIIAVHMAGNACAMDELQQLAKAHGLALIEDCAHALETEHQGRPAGTMGYGGSFSFYANKNITTGEGGMITTGNAALAQRLGRLRSHGMNRDSYSREGFRHFRQYDVVEPGYKANMAELQGALGTAQLARVDDFWQRRQALYQRYAAAFNAEPAIDYLRPPAATTRPGYHLFIVFLQLEMLSQSREEIMNRIADRGVQLSICYKPLHLFSYYQHRGYRAGDFPAAEEAYARMFALPFYPALTDAEADYVIETVCAVVSEARR
jgi:dTDP-4-amino-4,6-dideoxygalactose transaminase